jgi:undecaprenyl diphosphate synthase
MKDYRKLLDSSRIPGHIGIIMDGNGRWAARRSLPRSEGHRRGVEVIEPIVDACMELGVGALSLYVFSFENWSRPRAEIFEIWKLLEFFFGSRFQALKSKGIRITHCGSDRRLPSHIKKILSDAVSETCKNRRMILNLCLNYGGRQEIVEGVNEWLATRRDGESFTVKKMEKHLQTAGLPEVDLIIRTSGEYRISNFLLWQLAYSELAFVDVLWPDFRPEDLHRAVYDYQQRERRFGNI